MKQISQIDFKLKTELVLLALLMPLLGALSGWYYEVFVVEDDNISVAIAIGVAIGLVLDAVCYYGKVFCFVFYKMPIPATLFVIAYEVALFFVNQLVALLIGICGAGIGILMNMVLIQPAPFYLARKRTLIVIYIYLSFIMLGLMMGVPISNFLLGILAGNYFSLRYADAVLSKQRLHRNLLATTLFAAGVLLLLELLFAWLMWNDMANIMEYMYRITGFNFTQNQMLLLIVVLGSLAVVIQLLITRSTAITMYRYRVYKLAEQRRNARL